MLSVEQIASVCHETNRQYCLTLGDTSQKPWAEAPEWQQKSAIQGVLNIQVGKVSRPEQSHEGWLEEKERDGWTYGPVKDAGKKEHPCFVPYARLPEDQQKKDALFFAVAKALL